MLSPCSTTLGFARWPRVGESAQPATVEAEVDANMVIQLLEDSISVVRHSLSSLICDCRYLMASFESAKISHGFGESNRSADVLAKAALDSSLDFISFYCSAGCCCLSIKITCFDWLSPFLISSFLTIQMGC
ncbi:hypothetical protein RHMOL_Rhmol05G0268400 [Rhododendron molle]|uniref:Uncharacterized protein n=1 Tax=Rhododendron molle TaxID=49168 RepID=A0ACC0NTM2_RHOML|nr:hypothetical protein RHMOL_Rhmol05G0268400 [Rhododendron molle]